MRERQVPSEQKRQWYKSTRATNLLHRMPNAMKQTKALKNVYEQLPFPIISNNKEQRERIIQLRVMSDKLKLLNQQFISLIDPSRLTMYGKRTLEVGFEKLRREGIGRGGDTSDMSELIFYDELYGWRNKKSTGIHRRRTAQRVDQLLYLKTDDPFLKSEWRKEHSKVFHRDPDTGKLASS